MLLEPQAAVVFSRLPLAVVWLLSQTAWPVDGLYFTYLYWMAVPAGSCTVPLQVALAPLPWMVSANPLAGVQLPSGVWLPVT